MLLTLQRQAPQGLRVQAAQLGVDALAAVHVTQQCVQLQRGAGGRKRIELWRRAGRDVPQGPRALEGLTGGEERTRVHGAGRRCGGGGVADVGFRPAEGEARAAAGERFDARLNGSRDGAVYQLLLRQRRRLQLMCETVAGKPVRLRRRWGGAKRAAGKWGGAGAEGGV